MKIKFPTSLKHSQRIILIIIRYTFFIIVTFLLLFDLFFVYDNFPELSAPDVTTISGEKSLNESTFNEIIDNTALKIQSPYLTLDNIIDPFK